MTEVEAINILGNEPRSGAQLFNDDSSNILYQLAVVVKMSVYSSFKRPFIFRNFVKLILFGFVAS